MAGLRKSTKKSQVPGLGFFLSFTGTRAGRRDSELDNRSALFYNTAKLLTPKVLLAAEDAP